MFIGQYILDESGNPKPESDTVKWGRWLENRANTRVALDDLGPLGKVSTIFLGLDMDHWAANVDHQPVLWETMVFGGPHDKFGRRYRSREDAEIGHRQVVRMLKTETSGPVEQMVERIVKAGRET